MKPVFRYFALGIIAIALVVASRLAFAGVSQARDTIYVIPLMIFSVIMVTAYIIKVELKYKWFAFLLPLVVTAVALRLTVGLPTVFLS